MDGVSISKPVAPRDKPQILSLDEIEAQMAEHEARETRPFSHPGTQPMSPFPPGPQPPWGVQQPPHVPTPSRGDDHPIPAALAGSGYASQKALLDSMFPQLGMAGAAGITPLLPGASAQEQPPPREELERREALHQRITSKIEGMGRYNHLMGNSDKDFITRMQLSQLATADPYASDFYAQVFTALRRSREAAMVEAGERPAVVTLTTGLGVGVGAPSGNRFGKMGSGTMQKLSQQVKKMVQNRQSHQRDIGNSPLQGLSLTLSDALQGVLGRVAAKSTASGPRPVLAVSGKPEHRPTAALNQQSGIRKKALSPKQALYAVEELYDAVLDLEQMRRNMPPQDAVADLETWNTACTAKIDDIWRRMMVMEPLDVR